MVNEPQKKRQESRKLLITKGLRSFNWGNLIMRIVLLLIAGGLYYLEYIELDLLINIIK